MLTAADYGVGIGKTLASKDMKRSSTLAWLAPLAILVACSSPAAPNTPSPSPSFGVSPSFAPPPTPGPPQREEPSLPAPIEETAAAVAGGKLYVMGGFNVAGSSLDSVYVFDGAAWRSGPPLPLPLDHPSAATLDGHVYIAGGHSNGGDSARAFRLDGDHWTEIAAMHFARGGHALVADEGKLYAIGGNTSHANVPAAESYDPTGNAWTVLSSLPAPRNHVSGFVIGGRVCVAGGRYPTTPRVDCLDTAKGSWSRLPDLPQATSGGGATTFLGGGIVMMGGQDAAETAIVNQLTYLTQSSWSPATPMLVPRHGFELAVFNGRAWACGGGTLPGLHPVAVCTSVIDPGSVVRGR